MRRLTPPPHPTPPPLFFFFFEFLWWVQHSTVLGWKAQYFLSQEIKAPQCLHWTDEDVCLSGAQPLCQSSQLLPWPALLGPLSAWALPAHCQHQTLPFLWGLRIPPPSRNSSLRLPQRWDRKTANLYKLEPTLVCCLICLILDVSSMSTF